MSPLVCALGTREYRRKVGKANKCPFGEMCTDPKCVLAHCDGELQQTVAVPSPEGCCVPASNRVFVDPPLPPDPPGLSSSGEEEVLSPPGIILNLAASCYYNASGEMRPFSPGLPLPKLPELWKYDWSSVEKSLEVLDASFTFAAGG